MSATPGADEPVEDRRPGIRLRGGLEVIGGLEAIGGLATIGGLEAIGDEDTGLCVDGVCEIPAREQGR